MPGINRFFYEKGEYWPSKFETNSDLSVIKWLEERIYMITLWPRPAEYTVLEETNITEENVRTLTNAAETTWKGLITKDIKLFSEGFEASFNAQIKMFPLMMNKKIENVIDAYKSKATAWKLSGAGGGGYLILVSEKVIPDAIRIKIRIKDYWI
jgi:hypothetical protein